MIVEGVASLSTYFVGIVTPAADSPTTVGSTLDSWRGGLASSPRLFTARPLLDRHWMHERGEAKPLLSRYSDLGAPRVADFLYGRSLDRMLHRIGPLSLAATTVRIEIRFFSIFN